jgi:subtilisin
MTRIAICGRAAVVLVATLVGSGGATTFQPGLVGQDSAKAASSSVSSYIVVLQNTVSADAVTTSLERSLGFKSKFRYSAALKGFAADLDAQQVETLRANSQVSFVSRDGTVQADYVPIAPGDTAPTGVRRIGAAVGQTVKRSNVGARVAVLDTGVDLAHADLFKTAKSGTDCIQPGTKAQDDNGHGTHVAGTIAARNNGSDVVGVTPGTRIFAVKVLNANGDGTFAQVICGIDWVAANGPGTTRDIRVANMSLGGGGVDDGNCGNTNGDAMHLAICNAVNVKGVTFVVSAGNFSVNFANSVPAAYDEVLTVSAMADSDGSPGGAGAPPACRPSETDDNRALFSNFAVSASDQNHTIAGPGVCILSDRLGGGTDGTFSGTSMASPHVAGSVALCIGTVRRPGPCAGNTPAQNVQKLRSDAAAHATPGPIPGSSNGFVGDPNHPVAGRYYGFLVTASGYQ